MSPKPGAAGGGLNPNASVFQCKGVPPPPSPPEAVTPSVGGEGEWTEGEDIVRPLTPDSQTREYYRAVDKNTNWK